MRQSVSKELIYIQLNRVVLHGCSAFSDNLQGVKGCTVGDGIHHILTFHHFTKNGVFEIEPWGGHMRNKKLAAIGSRAGIGHAENTWTAVKELGVEFIDKPITRTAAAIALWIAALNHKVRDAAMEGQ